MALNISTQELSLYSALAGVISHLAYFIRGEHHTRAVLYTQLAISLPLLIFAGQLIWTDHQAFEAARLTAAVSSSFVSGLYTSMILYRACFHRLRSFRGPFLAKISKIWHVSRVLNMDNYRQLDKMHRQYGNIVRVGPSELSIITPEAVQVILGPGSKCSKAPWYDASLPVMSMHQVRDKTIHDKRRRIWDRGFSAKALRDYEGRLLKYVEELSSQISARLSQSLDASEWMSYFAFDVMGDLAFGKSFGMLKSGEMHSQLKVLQEGQLLIGILTPTPWMFQIMTRIPVLSRAYHRFISWCEQLAEERKRMHFENPDVMTWIIEAAQKSLNAADERHWMMGDSRLIVVAGRKNSDTTATTLTHLVYYMAMDNTHVEKLRQELDSLISENSNIDHKNIQGADYLNGMINETLRLHPPVPSGLLRVTPPEGIMIGNVHVPGETTVGIPFYSLGRSETIFESAEEFIPERWFSKPEMVKNKSAFAPFSLGPYSCIGKQLALMEIRTVVALLVTRFNIRLAPAETGYSLLEESKDVFTVRLGSLNVIFEARRLS